MTTIGTAHSHPCRVFPEEFSMTKAVFLESLIQNTGPSQPFMNKREDLVVAPRLVASLSLSHFHLLIGGLFSYSSGGRRHWIHTQPAAPLWMRSHGPTQRRYRRTNKTKERLSVITLLVWDLVVGG